MKNDGNTKSLVFFTNKIWENKANEQSEFSNSDLRQRSEIARFAARRTTRLGSATEDNSRQIQDGSRKKILKRGINLFRKVSTGKSSAHVSMELDKKIGARPNEESSTVHIKTRPQKTVSFSKSAYNNQPAVKSESLPARENKLWTRDELNATYLTNGLIKIARDKGNGIDNNKKKKLETAMRQLFSGRGEALNETILTELRTDADSLGLTPEVRYLSITLKEKANEALSKKAETPSKNLVTAEKSPCQLSTAPCFLQKQKCCGSRSSGGQCPI